MASVSSKGKKDTLSGLPDGILANILSFLPIGDAIRTSLLLRRFRNLWRSLPRLTIDNIFDDEKFVNFIHHVFVFHERVDIDELRIRHHFYIGSFKNPEFGCKDEIIENVIDPLISFAIIKSCKVLSLDFTGVGGHKLHQGYILPRVVYTSIHLTKLSLGDCDITSCDEVMLKSLKMLHLRAVVMNDEAMEKFVLGCPSLEELSLVSCYGLCNLCCSNNIKLKKLNIEHLENKFIILSNLNAVSLNVSGLISLVVVSKSSVVVDASVCYNTMLECRRSGRSPYKGTCFLLQSLDQCKTFRPCEQTVILLATWESINISCPCVNWKQLVLKLRLTNWVQAGLSVLLRHVPLLETLQIQIQPYNDLLTVERETCKLDKEKCWNEEEGGSLENLKMVVIHGNCRPEPDVIRVAKFVLRNAVALEKMVVSTKKKVNLNDPSYIFTCDDPENDHLLTVEMATILKILVASPKASTKAVISFI